MDLLYEPLKYYDQVGKATHENNCKQLFEKLVFYCVFSIEKLFRLWGRCFFIWSRRVGVILLSAPLYNRVGLVQIVGCVNFCISSECTASAIEYVVKCARRRITVSDVKRIRFCICASLGFRHLNLRTIIKHAAIATNRRLNSGT